MDAEEGADRDDEEDEYRLRTKKQPTDEQDEAELDAEDLLELPHSNKPKDSSLGKDNTAKSLEARKRNSQLLAEPVALLILHQLLLLV